MSQTVLHIEQLTTSLHRPDAPIDVVRDVSLKLFAGQTLGLVGESGSGKSMLALSILGLVPQHVGFIRHGHVHFGQHDLVRVPTRTLRQIRGNQIAMVFQDPMTALNPYMRIGAQLAEVLTTHQKIPEPQAWQQAKVMLEQVGISDTERRMRHYPHEFSGGMRQRVVIAMALLCRPTCILADEPTTALDVTLQAQVLDLIVQQSRQHNAAVLLVTHDLSLLANYADHIAVMYAGRIIEHAPAQALYHAPKHPYTRGLLQCVPRISANAPKRLKPIQGQPIDPAQRPNGCAFAARCERVQAICHLQDPPLQASEEQHAFACHAPLA